jgi:hypothetical protein
VSFQNITGRNLIEILYYTDDGLAAFLLRCFNFKGIVSRDFGVLFLISLNRYEPDQVFFHFNYVFVFKFFKKLTFAVYRI